MLSAVKAVSRRILPPGARRVLRDAVQLAQYATPNPASMTGVSLSAQAEGWYNQLKEHGVVKIEGYAPFVAVAEHLEKKYFQTIEADPERYKSKDKVFPWSQSEGFIQSTNKELYAIGGTEISCNISFRDPNCKDLLFNEDIAAILHKYYRRQPYYRNQPHIQKISYAGKNLIENGQFHVDHLHQLSIMLLVSDVTDKDTHMEFCLKSHRRQLLLEGVELPLDYCKEQAAKYDLAKCTGPRGTVFLFDTSGYHRANYQANSTRKILHLNYTTGHHMFPFGDRQSDLPYLKSSSPVLQKMFGFLEP